MTLNPPGIPSWADLSTPDLTGAKTFYGGLFGWELREAPEPEAGGYTLAHVDGKAVAGLGPAMDPEQPPTWTIYVATADADATAAKVTAAGGTVMIEPFDVLTSGRMAIFLDPIGAVIAAWQPYDMAGVELKDAPGALTWVELMARDPAAAKDFYRAVFGWTSADSEMPGMDGYTQFQSDGQTVGGLMPMDGAIWGDLPSHWMPYFQVADTDVAAVRVQELGGKVSVPPTTIPPGRFSVLNDPAGAVFSILSPPPA